VDINERFLAGQYKLTYLHGKGRQFVPVLIPTDCVKAIEQLIAYRCHNGITSENQFVFASKGMCIQAWLIYIMTMYSDT